MSKHQYKLEPNVSFTPDQKWVVFRSNMFGPTYVFAVEVAKASVPPLTYRRRQDDLQKVRPATEPK
jgi:hypothetical protein